MCISRSIVQRYMPFTWLRVCTIYFQESFKEYVLHNVHFTVVLFHILFTSCFFFSLVHFMYSTHYRYLMSFLSIEIFRLQNWMRSIKITDQFCTQFSPHYTYFSWHCTPYTCFWMRLYFIAVSLIIVCVTEFNSFYFRS